MAFTLQLTTDRDTRAEPLIRYDPSSSGGTITFPANPVDGQAYWLQNSTTNTTSITLAGNGQNVSDPATGTGAASITWSQGHTARRWIYTDYNQDGTGLWTIC